MATSHREVGALALLNKDQIKQAAGVLARAFYEDPLWVYFLPNETERPQKLFRMLRMLMNHSVLYSEVHATSPDLEGVSVWLPSAKVTMSPWRMLRSGALPVMLKMSRKEIGRSMRYTEYAEAVHEKRAPADHWYLQFIGVDPAFQGRGYAGGLLRPMLARMDAEGASCFLETQNRENVPIYEHYGFRVVEEGTIPGTDIGHWAMLR